MFHPGCYSLQTAVAGHHPPISPVPLSCFQGSCIFIPGQEAVLPKNRHLAYPLKNLTGPNHWPFPLVPNLSVPPVRIENLYAVFLVSADIHIEICIGDPKSVSRRSGRVERLRLSFCKEKREKQAQPSALLYVSAFSAPKCLKSFPAFFFLSLRTSSIVYLFNQTWGGSILTSCIVPQKLLYFVLD